MARCDQGYLCRVCGKEVEDIVDSELYLRYVIGEVDPETLHTQPECHLRCNPSLAQFIDDDRFQPPVLLTSVFAKAYLDPAFVKDRTSLINRGYCRLWEVYESDPSVPVIDYPLQEMLDKWCDPS